MWLSFLTRLQRPPFRSVVGCALRTSSGRTSLIFSPPPLSSVCSRNDQTQLPEAAWTLSWSYNSDFFPQVLNHMSALSTANAEGTGNCDRDFEETQWDGPQYCGGQGKNWLFYSFLVMFVYYYSTFTICDHLAWWLLYYEWEVKVWHGFLGSDHDRDVLSKGHAFVWFSLKLVCVLVKH